MTGKLNAALEDLQKQKTEAELRIQDDYYKPGPVYRDNERYSWAIQTLNKKYEQLRSDLIKQCEAKHPTP